LGTTLKNHILDSPQIFPLDAARIKTENYARTARKERSLLLSRSYSVGFCRFSATTLRLQAA
jgi:hypothetical protein